MHTLVMNTLSSRSSHCFPIANKQQAFSLIELLAVIAVLGLLTAILIPVVGGLRGEAARSENASNLRQLGNALNLHMVEHNGLGPYDAQDRGSNGIGKWLLGNRLVVFGPLLPYLDIETSPVPDETPRLFLSPVSTEERLARVGGPGGVETNYWMNPEVSYSGRASDIRPASLPGERAAIVDLVKWWDPLPMHNNEGKGLFVLRMNGSVEWISTEETIGFPGWNWAALDNVSKTREGLSSSD